MILSTISNDEPLCPMSAGFDTGPQAQTHILKNLILDEFYKNYEKDPDGEPLNEESKNVYHKVAYESRFSDRMKLFTATTSPVKVNPLHYVETFWYQCLLCGFVLPAYRENRS